MIKTFYHYSDKKFELDKNRTYSNNGVDRLVYKPKGLWLSDDDGDKVDNWGKWCEANEFRVGELNCRTAIPVDLKDGVLVLDTVDKIKKFMFEYNYNPNGDKVMDYQKIDWKTLCSKYKGIVISPYQWSLRINYLWYYGWDVACACIWDLSCVKELAKV
jgi:hypothetical protein